ncbi:hypothetical protein M413DRAFT_444656 [Hebeloma cylindrosporum]|uniref:Uncharacterized protein n=1 Tax=Hebeloma cylindrosporum TaxID=76867 RepID=A0A0C3C014_HEBCY|nr:hypothetical protein M413DRAFT_444656 [Hebeloma cylindrosporum h7]
MPNFTSPFTYTYINLVALASPTKRIGIQRRYVSTTEKPVISIFNYGDLTIQDRWMNNFI